MIQPDLQALNLIVVLGGLVLGVVFGFVGSRANFCTMGAVSDIVNMGDWTRMRMWLLAIGVALLGTTGLELAGFIKVANSIYTTPNLTWLSHLIGGAMFGFGMVLASGCASKTLMRIGGGNLKSVMVALLIAISAYMTIRGLFAPLRVNVLDQATLALGGAQDLPSILARATEVDRRLLLSACALVVGGGLVVWTLANREFRAFDTVFGGVVIGIVVVAGWYVSGTVGHLDEHPQTLEEAWIATNTGKMESLTFVGPQAFGLELLLLWTDQSRTLTFGISATLGVIVGSFAYALGSGSFRLEGFRDPEDFLNHLAGGVLMGFGGVLGLGCTVGQGITGLSTLALGAMITFLAIVAGGVAALRYQSWRIDRQMIAEGARA